MILSHNRIPTRTSTITSTLTLSIAIIMFASTIRLASSRFVSTTARSSCAAFLPTAQRPAMFSTTTSLSAINVADQVGNDVQGAIDSLATADAVCFDVDSTVLAEEGIDILAGHLGKGEEVSELTKRAMDGSTKFQDALSQRLDLLQPDRARILDCLEDHPPVLSQGIEALMQSLHRKKVDVWLVSGGFRIMIEPVAMRLNIPVEQIYANTIQFDDHGMYTGFDDTELTSRDMGKPKAVAQIKEKMGYETVVMVGDGATDAQAKPPADHFIGFGGIVAREAVKAKADWFVTDFDGMKEIVEARP